MLKGTFAFTAVLILTSVGNGSLYAQSSGFAVDVTWADRNPASIRSRRRSP